MRIRRATPGDAAAIAHVHVASWRATYPGIVPQPYIDGLDEAEFAERWRTRIPAEPGVFIVVAEIDGLLCGFASGGHLRKPVDSYDGEVYAIYLLPSMQRKGIGRKLFESIARELAAEKMRHLLVWTLRENPSTGFYARLGGKVVAEEMLEIGGASLVSVAFGWMNFDANRW